jgi:hypothetical protein
MPIRARLHSVLPLCALVALAAGCGGEGSDDAGDAGNGGGPDAQAGFAAVCAQFAETFTGCTQAQCAQVAAVRPQMVAYFTASCRAIEGNAVHEQVYRMYAAGTCDQTYYSASVRELIEDGGVDGNDGLVRFCAEGPLTPAETCATRCAAVTSCLTPSNPYALLIADAASCEYACAALVGLGKSIACLASTQCVDASCDDE